MYQGFQTHIVIMLLSYQPFHYNLMRNSCQPIIHNSWLASLNHTHSYQTFSTIPKTKQALSIQSQENNLTLHCLAQHLAQARRSRPGEPPSPMRGLKKGSRSTRGISLRREPSRLGEVLARSKSLAGRLGDLSCKSPGRAPCSSRLGETGSLGRD